MLGITYRVFSLSWPASMQIYWDKRKRLHKKGVQLPQDWFGTPTWPPFHCFGTPIWPPWRHVKTLYISTYTNLFRSVNNCTHYTLQLSFVWMYVPPVVSNQLAHFCSVKTKTFEKTHSSILSFNGANTIKFPTSVLRCWWEVSSIFISFFNFFKKKVVVHCV